ncbi:hypothetical protein CTAYLR_007550 [Chrysophaeum taylorii]|uniref:Peptidase S54 rhomboid domain-containing protein n=1 Tax=Chrysophaeum taylorii TaxID=2483200 RepID=A0AAD7U576_9STRA|nr:hypothetical protein CTAYLR_007550 [Chrysophaeum taylorii]
MLIIIIPRNDAFRVLLFRPGPRVVAARATEKEGEWPPLVSSTSSEPTAAELANENLVRIVREQCSDEEVNVLVWKCLGYRRTEEGWSNEDVFPKWRDKYAEPPDLVGTKRVYSKQIDEPVLRANQALVNSIPMKYKGGIKEHLAKVGWTGYVLEGLTPNKTRRAQCTNWLLFYREALFGKSLDELRAAKARDVAAENDRLREEGKLVNTTTSTLVTLNSAVFAAQCRWPSIRIGYASHIPSILAGEYWRCVTSSFLHSNIFHLVCNLSGLDKYGTEVERWYGRGRVFATYLAGAVGGDLASLWFNAGRRSNLALGLGASDAIFGLVGAKVVHVVRHRHLVERWTSSFRENRISLLIEFAFPLVLPFVDGAAHLGGFVGGVAAAYFFGCRFRPLLDNRGRLVGYVDRPLLSLGGGTLLLPRPAPFDFYAPPLLRIADGPLDDATLASRQALCVAPQKYK